MAMTHPEVAFIGIDSVKKKVIAVNEMITSLSLPNAKVMRSRIEEVKKQTFTYAIARAVAYVDKLIPWAYALLKNGGSFVLMKQKNEEEKAELVKICKQWNLQLIKEHQYTLFP
ncbi:MAG: class I SAM-dependent methyltransferase [Candidatus Peribacteria bacterium]|nr:class I SAM-dependent methyltransferase [Candidatus Peribacteria bacterium]